jgi:hypothetical protein
MGAMHHPLFFSWVSGSLFDLDGNINSLVIFTVDVLFVES